MCGARRRCTCIHTIARMPTAAWIVGSTRVGDVHTGMKLRDRMPAVAGALGAKVFETTYGVKCVGRTGPHNGAKSNLNVRAVALPPVPVHRNSPTCISYQFP